eukprot:gene13653-15679_t
MTERLLRCDPIDPPRVGAAPKRSYPHTVPAGPGVGVGA